MGTQSSVNIMLPSDISELFRSEGLHPRRMTLQPWATHRETRRHSKGVFLKWVPPRMPLCHTGHRSALPGSKCRLQRRGLRSAPENLQLYLWNKPVFALLSLLCALAPR